MGIFDVFKKKNCDICGGEIGLLGNRKLEDGNMCKDCAKKLSYWFDDRRHSTVDEINKQLSYREENKQAVSALRATRTIGQECIVHIDENAKKFMVVRTGDIYEENPDVLDFDQVTAVELDLNQSSTEIMREIRNSEGEVRRVSYNPRRWRYEYDFYVIIRVRHPFFDDMRFRLNDRTVRIDYTEPTSSFLGAVLGANASPTDNLQYQQYEKMFSDLQNILLYSNQIRPAAAAAYTPGYEAPAQPAVWNCPNCGAVGNAGKFCESCGTPRG